MIISNSFKDLLIKMYEILHVHTGFGEVNCH
jgi:hypothetical protein